MQILLLSDYHSLGFTGDLVEVKRGYARNYLIPKGIASEVNSRSGKESAHKFKLVAQKKAKLKVEALSQAEKLKQLTLEFKLAVGKGGKSFGSVSVKEIVDKLATKGITVDKKQFRSSEPIKTLGEHSLKLKIHSEVTADLKINVVSDRDESSKSQPKEIDA
jgi:large subunit ribosomal protein L9